MAKGEINSFLEEKGASAVVLLTLGVEKWLG